MNRTQPPRIATALLQWIGPRDEAVLGDLLERYRSDRSDWWYWREVAAAIIVGAFSEIRAHKLAAFRATALGWIVCLSYLAFVSEWIVSAAAMVLSFDQYLFVTGLAKWFYRNGVGFPDALMYVIGPLIVAFGWFLSGCTVGRLSRAHGAAMVLMYVATVAAVPSMYLSALLAGRPLGGPDSTLLGILSYATLSCTSSLIGGLWVLRPAEQSV